MKLTSEQKIKIERLFENESLTGNLVDDDAKALLEWAQQQIIANKDDALVRAAVSAANESGEEGAQTLIAHANTFLAQKLAGSERDASRLVDTSSAMTMTAKDSAPQGTGESAATTTSAKDPAAPEMLQAREAGAKEAVPALPKNVKDVKASGEASEQPLLTARADARIAPASSPEKPAAKKSRRSTKRRKKKSS